jgi:antitoxin MazE
VIVRLSKWGNSLALRIPAGYAKAIGVRENAKAELSIDGGRLVLRPVVETPRYDLDALLAQITDENRHEEIDSGSPVGAEFAASDRTE